MSDPTALPNFPPPADERPLRGRVLDALKDLELAPNIDEDGDVAFTVNDQQLFIRCLEGELTIMRTFGQWQLAEPVPNDVPTQLAACNQVNLSMTLAKTGLANGTLVVLVEHLVRENEDVRGITAVSIQAVLAAVQQWHAIVLGQTGEGEAPTEGTEQP